MTGADDALEYYADSMRGTHEINDALYAEMCSIARAILGEDRAGDEPSHTFPPTLNDVVGLLQQGPTLARLVFKLDRQLRTGMPLPTPWVHKTKAAGQKRARRTKE